VELSVSVFRIWGNDWNYGYQLKKHAELWILFWKKVAKIVKKSKGYIKIV